MSCVMRVEIIRLKILTMISQGHLEITRLSEIPESCITTPPLFDVFGSHALFLSTYPYRLSRPQTIVLITINLH